MELINYLKLKKSTRGIIDELFLDNLGQINVICGKNNSGKSSILEAISEKDNIFNKDISCSPGIALTNETIDSFLELLGSYHKVFAHPSNSNYIQDAFNDTIRKSIKHKKILYSNETDLFYSHFMQSVNEIIKQHIKIHESFTKFQNGINKYFNQYHNIKPKLIPAKRAIQETVAINKNEIVAPNGTGILRLLFTWKNRTGTHEKRLFNKFREDFIMISGNCDFDIRIAPIKTKNDAANQISLIFNYDNSVWRESKDCGLGLQDLMVILYFLISSENNVLCIEEPENHMHPEMQRRLLDYIYHNAKEKQIFISTHSNVFLDRNYVDRIFLSSYDGEKVAVKDETSKAAILSDLGYTVADNLLSDLIILVEGPSDVPVIQEFLIKMNLGHYNVKLWPLGGDIMGKKEIDLEVFSQNSNVMGLVDKDPKSSKARNTFKRKCKALEIPCYQLKRYAIENYFTVDALTRIIHKI